MLWDGDSPLGVQSSPELKLLWLHPRDAKGPLADANSAFSPPQPGSGMPCAPHLQLCLPGKEIAGLVAFKAHLKTSKQNEAGAFLSFYILGFRSI